MTRSSAWPMTAPTCWRDTIANVHHHLRGSAQASASVGSKVTRVSDIGEHAGQRARHTVGRSANNSSACTTSAGRGSPVSPRSATVTTSQRTSARGSPSPRRQAHPKRQPARPSGSPPRPPRPGIAAPVPRRTRARASGIRSGPDAILGGAFGPGRGAREWRACSSWACHVTLARIVRKVSARGTCGALWSTW